MSIAFESTATPGLHHGMTRGNVFDSAETGRPIFGIFRGGDHRLLSVEEDSSSSSSIGENSDGSGGPDSDNEGEVQSSCKGPLDALQVLEEVLPIKKGVSKFYDGKSKSYTSLEVAACSSSIKDIAKPENAFTRKRKNLIAHSIFFDKNRLKKPANNSHHLGLAVRMRGSVEQHSSSPVRSRPPLPPQNRKLPNKESMMPSTPTSFSPWRSFSLSDLQCGGDVNSVITCSDMNNKW